MGRPRKPKLGRPTDGPTARDRRVEVRATADEYRRWSAAAEAADLTLSDWLRAAAEQAIAPEAAELAQLRARVEQLEAALRGLHAEIADLLEVDAPDALVVARGRR